jgi:hypothetical protein
MQEARDARALALAVNDRLGRYIEVHGELFRSDAKRVIPIPGVFEQIDFATLTRRLSVIESDLIKNRQQISARLKAGVGNPPARVLLAVLNEYGVALTDTVQRLKGITTRLDLKAQNLASYSFSQYNADVTSYEASIARYRAIANKLNPAYAEVDRYLRRAE